MAIQQPKQKGFFAKYWWLFAGGGALMLIAMVAAAVLVYLFVLRGEAKVTALSLSSDSVAYGKKIEATITVENSRVLSAKFAGTLTVDGKERQLDEVSVESKETATVDCDLSDLKPGTHTLSIGGIEKKLKILKPAAFTVSGLTLDTTENILVGGTLTISANIKNTGEVKGAYEAKFSYDGTAMEPVSVDVEPGKEEAATVSFTVPANGDHEISIGDQKISYTAYNPAAISATDLKLAKSLAKPGEKISVYVTLGNAGDLSGKFTLEVLVNGKSAYTEEVTVDGGKQVEVPLEYSQDKAGTYVIQVADLKQTLRVAVITRPKTGSLIVKSVNSGRCTLTVTNSYTDRDAVIILVSKSNPKKQLLAFYVRAGEKTKKIKVKDGTYYIYEMTGTNYDSATKKFITNVVYKRFDGSLVTKTTHDYWATRWTDFTLKLYTKNGNTTSQDVSESDFPK